MGIWESNTNDLNEGNEGIKHTHTHKHTHTRGGRDGVTQTQTLS
jgi:hypothetical protein